MSRAAPDLAARRSEAGWREVVAQHPVLALLHGVSATSVPSLVPCDWRDQPSPTADPDHPGPTAPDLETLLGSPDRLRSLVSSTRDRALAARPRELVAGWARHLAALSELLRVTGSEQRAAFDDLLRRSIADRRAAGRTTELLIEHVVAALHERCPAPPGGPARPPAYSLSQALAMTCGHHVDIDRLRDRLCDDFEQWCNPAWLPSQPTVPSCPEVWSEVAADLRRAIRMDRPPTLGEALRRLIEVSPVRQRLRACSVPAAWVERVSDAAYQPLGVVAADGGTAGAVILPDQVARRTLSMTRLAQLLITVCHELTHAEQLERLSRAGPAGWLLAVSRPPMWFEGVGVAAEPAAMFLLADSDVERQVRFHRLRRLVDAMMLLRVNGAGTERWVRDQLRRLGWAGFPDRVFEGKSASALSSVVYAYGACVAEDLGPAGIPGRAEPAGHHDSRWTGQREYSDIKAASGKLVPSRRTAADPGQIHEAIGKEGDTA
ncbi:MAG TPA: hypothetical protein VIL37_01090 [Natronosporangium sp.]